MEELLNKVMQYIMIHDELPNVPEEQIEFAFRQYIHHHSIDIESAKVIEENNDYGLNAIDFCEFILFEVEQ